jgi:hypothetical protein
MSIWTLFFGFVCLCFLIWLESWGEWCAANLIILWNKCWNVGDREQWCICAMVHFKVRRWNRGTIVPGNSFTALKFKMMIRQMHGIPLPPPSLRMLTHQSCLQGKGQCWETNTWIVLVYSILTTTVVKVIVHYFYLQYWWCPLTSHTKWRNNNWLQIRPLVWNTISLEPSWLLFSKDSSKFSRVCE